MASIARYYHRKCSSNWFCVAEINLDNEAKYIKKKYTEQKAAEEKAEKEQIQVKILYKI